MTLRILRAAPLIESDESSHQARLLLLLRHARRDGTVNGITKLAKLDFFLRYPGYLRRLVTRLRKRPTNIEAEVFEENTVESKMIRFKYGPWDHRYRQWLGVLHAKGLIRTFLIGRTVHIGLTDKGREIAGRVAECAEFEKLDKRSSVVCRVLDTCSSTQLKNLVYELVPEITAPLSNGGSEWAHSRPLIGAYHKGQQAHEQKESEDDCPYKPGGAFARAWLAGLEDGKDGEDNNDRDE